jgi:hypothetical protein
MVIPVLRWANRIEALIRRKDEYPEEPELIAVAIKP